MDGFPYFEGPTYTVLFEPKKLPLPKPEPEPYPLNFCLWLHREFDRLVAEHNDEKRVQRGSKDSPA